MSAVASAKADPAALATARQLYAEKKYPEAQKAFETIAAAEPAHAEAHAFLGELALRRNEFDKAIAHFEKATAGSPKNGRYFRRLGDAYGSEAQKASIFRQPGLAKKCLAAYLRATELDPADIDAHSALFEYYRQAPGIMGGGMDKAAAAAATIKKLDAMRGRITFATLYTADKKYDQALAEFDEVLQTTPDDYNCLYQVGKLAAVSGQFLDRGATSLRRCLALTPPDRAPGPAAANWRLGQILEQKKDPAAAKAAYEAAVKADPNFAPAADALKKLR